MELPVPPYPPEPRHVPPELGQRPMGTWSRRWGSLGLNLFGIGLFGFGPLAFAALAVFCLLSAEINVIVRTMGFILSSALAMVSLRSLLPRRTPIAPVAIALAEEEEPIAHAFVIRVANELNCRPPRVLWIASGTELRVNSGSSLLDLLWNRGPELVVGMWLWQGLTLSEFQAAVARTLACSKHDPLRFRAVAVLKALVEGEDFFDRLADNELPSSRLARGVRSIHRIVTFPQHAIGKLLLRLGHLDEDVLSDDIAAVRLTGSDSLVHAILRADFAGASLHTAEGFLERASREGIYSVDMYAHCSEAATALCEAHNDFTLGQTPSLRSPNAGKYADVFEPGQAYFSTMWEGMPGPPAREQNAKRIFVACERDDRPASILISDPARLRGELTRLHYLEVWKAPPDFIALSASTVSNWVARTGKLDFPDRYEGCYDNARPIDPGTPAQRDAALANDEWDDARLLYTANKLYQNAHERVAKLAAASTALKKLRRKTLFRPIGRERVIAEDLEEDVRKMTRWLAALDRWAFVVHMHMAARLPDLSLHGELLEAYDRVLRFQELPSSALEYRDRVAAFVRSIREEVEATPYAVARDAKKEFKASRKDFAVLLEEAAAIDDAFLAEQIGGQALDLFVYAHAELPASAKGQFMESGRQLLSAWEEVLAKSRWLHHLGLVELLQTQERIRTQFSEQVGDIPEPHEDALELELVAENPDPEDIDLEPEFAEAELVDDE